MPDTDLHRRAFREAFRSSFGDAFQSWFVDIARRLHPPGDFQVIRNSRGDGGLDGFSIGSQLAYQVYAPARIHELRDAETARKIRVDFRAAFDTLGGRLRAWHFVHNHPQGAVGQLTAAAMSELAASHPSIRFRVLDIDSLWEEVSLLPRDVLGELFPAGSGSTPEGPPVADDLAAVMVEAQTKLNRNCFGDAVQLLTTAVGLARTLGDRDEERRAVLRLVRALSEQIMDRESDETERGSLLVKVKTHIDELESLGETPARVALERALAARLSDDPEAAVALSDAALSLNQGDVFIDADALIAKLQALWQLDRVTEALSLAPQVALVRSRASDDPKVALQATWVRTLCKAAAATDVDIEQFMEDVRGARDSHAVSLDRLALIVHQVESEFGRSGDNETRLALCECAYDLLEPSADRRRLTLLSLQAAELAAVLGNAQQMRRHLRNSDVWADRKLEATSREDHESETTFRALTMFMRGRSLARLGDRSEPSGELYQEAYITLKNAAAFSNEHRTTLRGNVDLFRADLAWWLGRTAINVGRLEEAADTLRLARTDAAMANEHFVVEVATAAWTLEAEALAMAGNTDHATRTIDALLSDERVPETSKGRPRALRKYFDHVIRPMVDWFQSPAAASVKDLTLERGLRSAVAEQVKPLLSWWNEWQADLDMPQPLAELVDFWGRGGFARVAAAVRAKAHGAVAVDAWTIDDIRRWVRILCPLFDTVIVKWKGELGTGFVISAIRADYGDGPDDFGGHGYSVTAGSVIRRKEDWHPALSWANPFPTEVAQFLAREALGLVSSGRLVLLPAPLVGCTQSAIGWTDDLLVGNFLGGVVDVATKDDGIRSAPPSGQRVLDLAQIRIPYISGVTMSDLGKVLDDTEPWTDSLRSLLFRALANGDLRHERWERISSLEIDIREACRELRERTTALAKRNAKLGWAPGDVTGGVSAGSRPDTPMARDPITSLLQSISSSRNELAPWIPYLRLQDNGGHLDWTCPLDNPSKSEPDRLKSPETHSWLYPGTGGWTIPTAFIPR